MAAGADTAHVMMMGGLLRARAMLVSEDLGAVFARLAVHRRLPVLDLADTVSEGAYHSLVVAQVQRLNELDFREKCGDIVGLRVDPFDQHPGEQEIRKHDDAAKPESGRPRQGGVDPRMDDAAEPDLGPPQGRAFP